MAIAEKSRAADSYLSFKAPLIVRELKDSGDGGPVGQWKGEISHYLVQGGEMPGLVMAQTWTSALEICSDGILGAEEAQC